MGTEHRVTSMTEELSDKLTCPLVASDYIVPCLSRTDSSKNVLGMTLPMGSRLNSSSHREKDFSISFFPIEEH